jgi:hypothetical protein
MKKSFPLVSPTQKAVYGVGDNVSFKSIKNVYGSIMKQHGKIIDIPKDGTIIYEVHDDINKLFTFTWKKNDVGFDSVESFVDQPRTGSVWYISRIKKYYNGHTYFIAKRKYFVQSEGKIYFIDQDKLTLTRV